SARIADKMGFSALYMTGYGVSASLLGKPDAGYLTATHMADRVRTICAFTETPLIADADTGFGGLINVQDAVQAYELGGAAAIQLEDQQFPKRCGHTKNRTVIPLADAVKKIKMAVQSRQSDDFLIVARTDARTSLGFDEALRRGEAFAKAGADILFIESPENVEEMNQIGQTFPDQWLLANMVPGGRTPILPAKTLAEMGFNIAIHPVSGLMAAAAAYQKVYNQLEDLASLGTTPMPFAELNKVIGFEAIWAMDEDNL
ncbi:MAG: isocitrate lyase/PEP mutase family protein, partial [Bacteroidota bacterium]